MGDNVCLTEQDVEGKYRAGFLNLCATDILDQVTLGRGAVVHCGMLTGFPYPYPWDDKASHIPQLALLTKSTPS